MNTSTYELTLVRFPAGTYGFNGSVPAALAFVDPTPDQLKAGQKFGGRFGPRRRVFATAEEARQAARNLGHDFADAT